MTGDKVGESNHSMLGIRPELLEASVMMQQSYFFPTMMLVLLVLVEDDFICEGRSFGWTHFPLP